jgi:hypothetical protein
MHPHYFLSKDRQGKRIIGGINSTTNVGGAYLNTIESEEVMGTEEN